MVPRIGTSFEDGVCLFHGDGPNRLRSLPANSVAAVVTDPPWNLSRDYGPHTDDARPPDQYHSWMEQVLSECMRVARDGVVLLPGSINLSEVASRLATTGWWRTVMWWQPSRATPNDGSSLPSLSLQLEPVLWMGEQPPPGSPDLSPIAVPLRPDPHLLVHPCAKPVALAEELIRRCVHDPGPILDPFTGTGSTLLAALRSGRRAIGVDLNNMYLGLARKRIRLGPGRQVRT